MNQVRMYGLPTCVACQKAALFLQAHGIITDLIDVTDDPVAMAGLLHYSRKPGQVETPTLISPATKQIVRGFDESEYRGLVDALRGASGSNTAAPELQATGAVAPQVEHP